MQATYEYTHAAVYCAVYLLTLLQGTHGCTELVHCIVCKCTKVVCCSGQIMCKSECDQSRTQNNSYMCLTSGFLTFCNCCLQLLMLRACLVSKHQYWNHCRHYTGLPILQGHSYAPLPMAKGMPPFRHVKQGLTIHAKDAICQIIHFTLATVDLTNNLSDTLISVKTSLTDTSRTDT